MKATAKNKFLLCFRPAAMDDDAALKPDGGLQSSEGLAFAYISVTEKGDLMIPAILSPLCAKASAKEESLDRPRRKIANRAFSRIVKAVLFETLLFPQKKVHNGKVPQDPYRSDGSVSEKDEKLSNARNEKSVLAGSRRKPWPDVDRKINSGGPSSFSSLPFSSSALISSSSSSSTSCSSSTSSCWPIPDPKKSTRSSSFEPKEKNRVVQSKQIDFQQFPGKTTRAEPTTRYSSTYSSGLYLLLISLFFMVFWGRLCAILLTSTWLYLVPRWRSDNDEVQTQPKNAMSTKWSPELDSKEYKKKVIMEGLLERNHHHRVWSFHGQ
ncbi:PREDICTED: uncharacterized protein LOC104612235 [Nelumbo nucifera]|uniref:Uncharacterized protein LOC104612235 n=2 Tax=Nelumbo nucifera TaxID=4432 RepID=A0A1U8B9L9_NELNU|nr:PREDICTED: uncharacterized protein LOC104612235 [Nelumbo nucifera]DAD20731.1 TPA_asm: hypothetical protein HUJ06_022194 [Nelumbo nucifera]